MTPGRQLHLRSLTSLRFFAAALVVVFHAAIQSSASGFTQPFAVLRFGYLGVTFFFILSGFVLVWSAHDGDRMKAFYRRRFARVWPLHALTFALAIVAGSISLLSHRGPPWSAPVNLMLLQAWFRDGEVIYGYNGVSWSLSCEAFFYAVFPMLYFVVRRVGPIAALGAGLGWLAIGGAVAEITNDGWWAGVLPAYRIGEFVAGMALAGWVRRGVPSVRPNLAVAVLCASYGLVVVLNRLTAGEIAPRPWLAALIVFPGIALVLLAYARRDLNGGEGWLTKRGSVRLGQWSFALYMLHELLFRCARPLLIDRPWSIPLVVVAAVALAGALYEWFERPVERRLRGRSAPAVQLEPFGERTS